MNRRSKKSKFRSVFEEHTAEVLEGFDYEPYTVPYTIHRNYRPDFVHAPSDTLVECKGFFREGDTKKYTSIRDSLEDYQRLVFVLMNPNKKVRKGKGREKRKEKEKANKKEREGGVGWRDVLI